ncbi:MAG: type 1 glutamine amidotransferase [Candidatus Abyssobacteria bacterium SURF_17]|uniref:Type 1 glutamine amidotransferase n=1 Tax=Candidatus Abyssobacteria bacterium SURF_17 TaxID=2093361 RepID=A0A419EWT8_9BACT|nr:MAG: type 1 glutamine amidotransferase [Candidatus Abyssubacteria bacterium SURF_17]
MELKGKKVLILADDMYEDMELWYPKIRLTEAGATVKVAGVEKRTYHGKHGYPVEADDKISAYNPKDFDCVVIPGGYAPDRMRRSKSLLDFVKKMHDGNKVVASICHAAWVPISAGIVKGKTMTCFYAIKDDLVNAGAKYVDQSVVVDGNIVSSRTPDDLPDFCKAIISLLAGKGEYRPVTTEAMEEAEAHL